MVRPRIGFPCLCGAALLRCCGPPLGRQNDQALIVRAPLYEAGHFGVADRLLEVVRAPGTEAVELGDERRRALKTVSGDHQPMVPQWHAACQPGGTLYSRAGG